MRRCLLLVLLALPAIAAEAGDGGAAPAPKPEDWLERNNRLATLLGLIQAQGVNATAEDPKAVSGLRDAIRSVTDQMDQAAAAQQAGGRQAPLATTTYAARSTGPALFLYWNYRAPEATTLFPTLAVLRQTRPGLAIYHVHLQPPSEWQRFFLEFRTAALEAQRDAELLGQVAAARKWAGFSNQYEPLRAAAAFDGTPGVAPFTSVASAIAHRAVRIPTWRYRTQRGIVHALTGAGPHLDLGTWIDRCEAWDAARAAEAEQQGVSFQAIVASWKP